MIPISAAAQDPTPLLHSTVPLALDPTLLHPLEKLGHRLLLFTQACNELYHRSAAGRHPPWVSALLDRGKPPEHLALTHSKAGRSQLPEIFAPELIVHSGGLCLASLHFPIPESVAPDYAPDNAPTNQGTTPTSTPAHARSAQPFPEEQLWLALLLRRPLKEFWRREMGERHFLSLLQITAPTWILDPEPLPPYAVIPGLQIQSWETVAEWPRSHRQHFRISASNQPQKPPTLLEGSSLSDAEWKEAVSSALEAFPVRPHVLQQLPQATQMTHRGQATHAADPTESVQGDTRLHPQYHHLAHEKRVELRSLSASLRSPHCTLTSPTVWASA